MFKHRFGYLIILVLLIFTTPLLPQKAKKSSISPENQLSPDSGKAFVYVKGGTMVLGKSSEFDEVKMEHKVTLDDFIIARFELTQAEWAEIMDNNPSIYIGENLPVHNISWDTAQIFLKKLREVSGCKFRLPTEAEWEYAARGGQKSKGFKYSGSNDINEAGWMYGTAEEQPHEVGLKKPNELGLYDMSGNVAELCSDNYDYGYYAKCPPKNPQGPKTGDGKVVRGGNYTQIDGVAECTSRSSNYADYIIPANGLRLVCDRTEAAKCIAFLNRLVWDTRKISAAVWENNFVLVKGGTFMMGDKDDPDSGPVHKVTLDDFYISKYEMTQQEWSMIMKTNPSENKGPRHPIENIWPSDIKPFMDSMFHRTWHEWRLPTEAEWEYAARGGIKDEGYKFGSYGTADQAAWYYDNSKMSTHPVGQKFSNPLGLFDVAGNVSEWCSDNFDKNYYAVSPEKNPKGPEDGLESVLRGGSYQSFESSLNVRHHWGWRRERLRDAGFRVVFTKKK